MSRTQSVVEGEAPPRPHTTTQTRTSESVCEGHPDKVADFIADSILDAYISLEPRSRVACEVLCKSGVVVVAGEISSTDTLDHVSLVKEAIRSTGYDDPGGPFSADGVNILQHVTGQSWEIGRSVDPAQNLVGEQGAGDQGIVFGYATDETPEGLPLSLTLAHALARGLAEDRRRGAFPFLRPDGKTQVSVEYAGSEPLGVSCVVVSTQHAPGTTNETLRAYVTQELAPRVLGKWVSPKTEFLVNPSGSFVHGGPAADCGLTGRKLIVDTYGGAARHGGGALSGKDPSKVDRSGAYFCRYVARKIVAAGIARRAEIQVAYAIGVARPVSLSVDTFGTGEPQEAEEFLKSFDFRPGAIIERLDLLRPIYRRTTHFGHFGKPDLPWES